MKIRGVSTTNAGSDNDLRILAKLTDAAQQFESMLLQEMLKPLRPNRDGWSDKESSESGSDTISSFGVEAMAKAISKSGGLGIARQVIQQVTAEHEKTHAVKTSGNLLHQGDR